MVVVTGSVFAVTVKTPVALAASDEFKFISMMITITMIMMMTKMKSRLPERSYFQVLRNQMMKI